MSYQILEIVSVGILWRAIRTMIGESFGGEFANFSLLSSVGIGEGHF